MKKQIFFSSQRLAQKAADELFYENPDSLWVVGNEITDKNVVVWYVENLEETEIYKPNARLKAKK